MLESGRFVRSAVRCSRTAIDSSGFQQSEAAVLDSHPDVCATRRCESCLGRLLTGARMIR